MKTPPSLKPVVDELAALPSIGPRQAIRLAFYLINEGKAHLRGLSAGIAALAGIKICERCFFIHENEDGLCDICRNPHRAQDVIMVVEKETDLLSLENTGKFAGRYFIVGEISKTGFLEDRQKTRLRALKEFIAAAAPAGLGGQAAEIVLAFNPTSLGDLQASVIARELAPLAKKITRLGRGLPTGGEIEFADEETLGAAMERRS